MKSADAETIGAFDAKTHLSALLDQVARGSEFLITKHGRPVARLCPIESGATAALSLEDALAQARQFRSRLKLRFDRAEINELIATGRR